MHSTTDLHLVVRAGRDFHGGMARVQSLLTETPFEPDDRLTISTDLPLRDVSMLVEAIAMDHDLPMAVSIEPLRSGGAGEAKAPAGPLVGADGLVTRVQHMRFEPGDSVLLTVKPPLAASLGDLRSLATYLFPPGVNVSLVEEGRVAVELRRLDAVLPDWVDPMH